jgi:hypothetical protein
LRGVLFTRFTGPLRAHAISNMIGNLFPASQNHGNILQPHQHKIRSRVWSSGHKQMGFAMSSEVPTLDGWRACGIVPIVCATHDIVRCDSRFYSGICGTFSGAPSPTEMVGRFGTAPKSVFATRSFSDRLQFALASLGSRTAVGPSEKTPSEMAQFPELSVFSGPVLPANIKKTAYVLLLFGRGRNLAEETLTKMLIATISQGHVEEV